VAEEAMTKYTSLLGFTTVRESRDRSRKNGAVIIQRTEARLTSPRVLVNAKHQPN